MVLNNQPIDTLRPIDTSDPLLIAAVQRTFGTITVDLAAQKENAVVHNYISEAENTFTVDWTQYLDGGLGWLNPPTEVDLTNWTAKCVKEAGRGARILLFTEAALDTAAFWAHLWPNAAICMLHPRISYDHRIAPTMIAAFNTRYAHRSLNLWLWEQDHVVESTIQTKETYAEKSNRERTIVGIRNDCNQ